MKIKWRYENTKSYEEAVRVAEKAVAGSQWSRNDSDLELAFDSWQAEEKFTIAYQRRDYPEWS